MRLRSLTGKEAVMQGWKQGLAVFMVTAAIAAPALAQGGAPPMAGGPMMGTMGGDKPSPKTVALQKKADQLEAQYKKKPNDNKLKMQLSEAKYEYGHARMFDPALSPREKYRP